jgi:HME family heavy-metal exporter
MVAGVYQTQKLQVDVLPDLSRPRIIVMTECSGMAPEEVETLVTVPIETYLNGATGVTAIRSSSTSGLSAITVEFEWNMEAFRSRQIVDERLQLAIERLPAGIVPRMVPMASMMGQVMYLTVWDEKDELSAMELRTLADWVLRKRILSASGIAEVLVIGGDVKQYQVRARVDDMFRYNVSLDDLRRALEGSNRNVTGGILTEQGVHELLVRSEGRLKEPNDLKSLTVKSDTEPPIQLYQVADIETAPAIKVGSSGVDIKNPDGTTVSRPAVVLTVTKQVGEDTRALSKRILAISNDIQKTLNINYPNIRIAPLYQQQTFIELAVDNVMEALYLGAILIVIVLMLFLMNFRATCITLLAMPLSILSTCLVFAWFGLSINTMTLGGLAVAIGELVDDAIVDVENISRRLRENWLKPLEEQISPLLITFHASREIRNSIVYGTIIVVIVFMPVFFLSGMEGKMFAPMGIAYIVSLLSSLLVSLTVTPVLAFLLLSKTTTTTQEEKEGFLLKMVKSIAGGLIRFSLTFPRIVLITSVAITFVAVILFFRLERDFMPPFNEGAPQVNISLEPGTSLKTSEQLGKRVAKELLAIEGVTSVVRKTGRAELDDHIVPVNTSEMLCTLDLKSGRSIASIFADIDEVISPENIPGVVAFYDQPLQHLIAHLRTGTRSKIAIKVRGDDPLLLRRRAIQIQGLLATIPDIGNPRIDPPQKDIPQVRFKLKRNELATYGLIPEDVNATIETAMQGIVVTEILEGQRTFEVLLRVSDDYRENLALLSRMPIRTPSGLLIPLSAVTDIDEKATGPNRIEHENGQTQITIQMNPSIRGAVDVKNDIDATLMPYMEELTSGNVFFEITGLFQSEQESSRALVLLSFVSLVCIIFVLYRMFNSFNMSFQILSSLPMALVGGVFALILTGQPRSIPALVGMISLCGIASRNGILIIDHYFHLVRFEGESVSKKMIIHAGMDRTAPVLMTALTSSLGLVPIVLTPEMPGREILYPIATVVVGGLFTSTVTEFFVRPALFWVFGRKRAEIMIEQEHQNTDNII